jgi:hypothetical protein
MDASVVAEVVGQLLATTCHSPLGVTFALAGVNGHGNLDHQLRDRRKTTKGKTPSFAEDRGLRRAVVALR